ncbi:hypothetical protein N2152v2_007621 [Parachlorella kessleri]
MEDTFIDERLAVAMELPPSQRSPEVAAFIEACQLQQEVAMARKGRGGRSKREQQALSDLKLVKSQFLSIAPFCYRPGVQLEAWHRLCSAAKITDYKIVGVTGRRVMELLDADFRTGTLLSVAAGVSALGLGSADITRLLPVYNSVVEKMQRPAVAACLRQELEQLQADLPCSLLSYEQLLAVFVMLGIQDTGDLAAKRKDDSMAEDAHSALRVVGRYRGCTVGTIGKLKQVRELFERAQQQGSDFVVGYCGYDLAAMSADYAWYAWRVTPGQAWGSSAAFEAMEVVVPPSAFLAWLKQARQALMRCQAVLPGQWLAGLKVRQQAALAWKPWLQRQQQLGDRWQLPDSVEMKLIRAEEARQDAAAIADRSMRGSRKCQKADWAQHKSSCKASQQHPKGQSVGYA